MKGIIRKARLQEAKRIHELIQPYARKRLMLARPVAYIIPRIRDFFVWENEGKVNGCVALRVWNEKWAEVIALAVDKKYGMQGAGSQLLNCCISDAKELGVRFIVTFTSKDDLAKRAGFKRFYNDNILPGVIFTEKTISPEKMYILELEQ